MTQSVKTITLSQDKLPVNCATLQFVSSTFSIYLLTVTDTTLKWPTKSKTQVYNIRDVLPNGSEPHVLQSLQLYKACIRLCTSKTLTPDSKS